MRRLISRVFMALVLLCGPAVGADPSRSTLDIWCATPECSLPNERAFWEAFRSDSRFEEAMRNQFAIRKFSISQNRFFALTHGIHCGPMFIVDGRLVAKGFRGTESLLAELGVKTWQSRPQPPAEVTTSPPSPAPGISDQTIAQLRSAISQGIANAEARLRSDQNSQLQASQSESLRILNALAEKIDTLQAGRPDVASLQEQLQTIRSQLLQIRSSDSPAAQGSQTGSSPPSFWARPVRIFNATLSIAQLLGVLTISGGSLGVAGLGVWGAKCLFRWWFRIPAAKTSPAAITAGRALVACSSCAANQKELNELASQLTDLRTELKQARQERDQAVSECESLKKRATESPLFAPYETDSFREAYEWAAREVVRKFPGAVDNLEQLKNLINQHLTSKGKGRPLS